MKTFKQIIFIIIFELIEILFCFQESDNITAPLRLVEIFSDLSRLKADVSVTLFRVLVLSIELLFNFKFDWDIVKLTKLFKKILSDK